MLFTPNQATAGKPAWQRVFRPGHFTFCVPFGPKRSRATPVPCTDEPPLCGFPPCATLPCASPASALPAKASVRACPGYPPWNHEGFPDQQR